MLLFLSSAAHSETIEATGSIELTYYLTTKHFKSDMGNGVAFNNSHSFFGVEYRKNNNGISISSFQNSYYNKSYMVDYAYYSAPYKGLEFSARFGFVSGYKDEECGRLSAGKICPSLSLGVAHVRDNRFIPKISIAPGFIALSFSTRL